MRIAIAGAGAVGTSVLELAEEYGHTVVGIADSSSAATGDEQVDVESVLQRKEETGAVGTQPAGELFKTEYDVLVEATPTTLGDAQPAFSHCQRALEEDRHVVLANKGPVAERYTDLRKIETQSNGSIRFEATVGGAIPAIRTIEDYGPEKVLAARGVLNGTANFVLTRMAAEGLSYEKVLSEAQELGVAETDPSFDVEGTDAALKCVIMANVLTCGDPEFTLSDATVEGITDIPGSALDLAAQDNKTIRLIGEATRDHVKVGPRLVPENGPLSVTGTRNIVQIDTEHAGRLNLSGRGAGGPETATAVLADVGRLG